MQPVVFVEHVRPINATYAVRPDIVLPSISTYEPWDGMMVGGMAEIFFRNTSFTGTSKVNQYIQKPTKGKMAQPWAGPVMAFRRMHLNLNLSTVMDKDLPVTANLVAEAANRRPRGWI
ncbi:hypothetical protein FRB94_013492 [Tulasnella sp. JGI-2019a]|nr:hypothetical protein FRB94_013492 [Tulasnella sp. JGI-2019a]